MITTPAPAGFLDPIPGVMPFGSLSIFGGAPGVGKTTMIKDWIRRWTAGQTICGRATNCPTRFYFLAADRQQDDLVEHLPGVEIYALAHDPLFNHLTLGDKTQALTVFAGCINRLDPQPGGLLITDPVTPLFIPGSINDPHAVARTLLFMSHVNRERQITSLCTAHFHKQPSDAGQKYRRPQDRIAGSTAFSGYTDTQMYLMDPEEPEQPYHLFGWNPRRAKQEFHKFTRVPDGFVPYRSLEEVGGLIAIPESTYPLFVLIPDEGSVTGELEAAACAMLGISRAKFFRLLAKLEKHQAISRPHGWIKRIAVSAVRVVPDGESEDKPN